jgi:nucleoid DNA-binding protein
MNLAKDIAYLLYNHNCVIVPNFGAFIVNEKNAEMNTIAKYASPKQHTITFNSQIINNDGLLANHLSVKHQVSFEEGNQFINQYIENLDRSLNKDRNVEVTEIGTFYLTQEEKLIFVPYHAVNFAKESFGLPKLRLKTIEATEAPKVVVATKDVTKAEPKLTKKTASTPEKKIAIQEKRTKKRVKAKSRTSNLSIVNVLGSFFLIGMFFALLNFELNTNNSAQIDQNFAGILDTPSTEQDVEVNEVIPEFIEEPVVREVEPLFTLHSICTEDLNHRNEADILLESLIDKYSQAQILSNDDGTFTVSIISFSNESLAHEYKELIQNRITEKLVIKTK